MPVVFLWRERSQPISSPRRLAPFIHLPSTAAVSRTLLFCKKNIIKNSKNEIPTRHWLLLQFEGARPPSVGQPGKIITPLGLIENDLQITDHDLQIYHPVPRPPLSVQAQPRKRVLCVDHAEHAGPPPPRKHMLSTYRSYKIENTSALKGRNHELGMICLICG